MLKLAKDAVNKNLIIIKIYLKKILKFFLCHQILVFIATFSLVLLLENCSVEKQDGKKDSIWSIGLNNFKKRFHIARRIDNNLGVSFYSID